MRSCFYQIAMHRRPVSYMLIVAVLSLTLFPLHFHLHHAHDAGVHDDAAHGHAHTVDLHGLTEPGAVEHHDDSHAIEPTTYTAVKLSGLQLPLFFAAFVLLALLLPGVQHVLHRTVTVIRGLGRDTRYRLPLLRAPPLA